MKNIQTTIKYLTLLLSLFIYKVGFTQQYDVAIWGNSLSGINTAIEASERNMKVALIGTTHSNENLSSILSDSILSKKQVKLVSFISEIAKEAGVTAIEVTQNSSLFNSTLKYYFSENTNVEVLQAKELLGVTVEEKNIKEIQIGSLEYSKKTIEANYFINASTQEHFLLKLGVPLLDKGVTEENFTTFYDGELNNAFWESDEAAMSDHPVMKGYYRFSALNAIADKGRARANIQKNSIASNYFQGFLILNTTKDENIKLAILPYTVPFFTLVPQKIDNLLSTEILSVTSLGAQLLSTNTVKIQLGKVAGIAASICNNLETPFKKLPVELLQRELLREKEMLVYFTDISSESPYFDLSQFFALKGYFKETSLNPEGLLDEKTANFWQFLSNKEVKFDEGKTTRGEFLLKLYKKIQKK